MIARADRTREAGQSLVEMIVVVSIFLVVMATITGAFFTVQRTSDEIDNRFENIGEAQKLIAATTRDVRTATPVAAGGSPFLVADKRRMTFYANLNFAAGSAQTLPNKVDILIDSTNPAAPVLKEYIWVPTNASDPAASSPTYNATATTLRLVGQYVANVASDPIFRYFDANGVELTAMPLVAADQIMVRTVKIALSVRKQTTRAVQPTRVKNTVRLANVIYGNLTAS